MNFPDCTDIDISAHLFIISLKKDLPRRTFLADNIGKRNLRFKSVNYVEAISYLDVTFSPKEKTFACPCANATLSYSHMKRREISTKECACTISHLVCLKSISENDTISDDDTVLVVEDDINFDFVDISILEEIVVHGFPEDAWIVQLYTNNPSMVDSSVIIDSMIDSHTHSFKVTKKKNFQSINEVFDKEEARESVFYYFSTACYAVKKKK